MPDSALKQAALALINAVEQDWPSTASHRVRVLAAAKALRGALPAPAAGEPEVCACGDLYPANSWGAGFMAARGMCPNCDAAAGEPEMPTLPQDLLNTIGEYGMARTARINEIAHYWQLLIVGIKDYARAYGDARAEHARMEFAERAIDLVAFHGGPVDLEAAIRAIPARSQQAALGAGEASPSEESKDAARYRWLRQYRVDSYLACGEGEDLDAAIDAILAAAPPQGEPR